MGLSVPQYFNEYTSVAGYGPVHTGARWVCTKSHNVICGFFVLLFVLNLMAYVFFAAVQ